MSQYENLVYKHWTLIFNLVIMNTITWYEILNSIFFIYACFLFGIYLFHAVLSLVELRNYSNKNKYVDYKAMLSYEKVPSVSVIAPAYNEEKSIVDNIKCLTSLQYQDYDVVIVNDGSTDGTLSQMIKHFDLVEVTRAFDAKLYTQPILAVYQSRNPALNHLTVIDKENGGKADALNAAINVSSKDLFLAIDVDCIIEPDAIQRMVKPFIDEDNKRAVIASGGVIRIVNSCEIEGGNVSKVNFPKNFWAKFQVLEYFRAFTLGRMAWSKLNGLLIISGAFGLFDRKRVVNVGGYDRNSVGEDLELVLRLRRYMHEVEKKKYRVAFIPDPLCWTEVPETFDSLFTQRNRWTRGAIGTIIKHRRMFLNPKYGLIGMVSFPNWVFFEWLGPIVQAVGLVYFAFLAIFGLVDYNVFLTLLVFVFTFSTMYSMFAVLFEVYAFNKYKGIGFFLQSFMVIFLEMIIFQPLNMFFSLSGHLDYYFRKKTKNKWGNIERVGFNDYN
jgi:poly-beta-1,6-N-acetyl-D-glucosamine synthase